MMTETSVVDPYSSSHDLHKEAQRLNIQLDLITKSNIQLREELEQTSREKVQAAEYGLAVLEEKQVLQQMYDDLEVMYETTRQELDLARGALDSNHLFHKQVNAIGIHHEESLLQETATREADLLRTISNLESDIKTLRHSLEQRRSEYETTSGSAVELSQTVEMLELANRHARKEIKELKFKESRSIIEYSELEEENITLQKQLLHLKQTQVDYEATKYDNKRLQEDAVDLNCEIEELHKLKKIVERNLEETMLALEQEREQRHSLKKELTARRVSESMSNLNCIAGLSGLRDLAVTSADQDDGLGQSQGSIVGDLFSEIHVTEIRKLELALEATELEKEELTKLLADARSKLDLLTTEMEGHAEKMSELNAKLTAITEIDGEVSENLTEVDEQAGDIVSVYKRRHQQELRYKVAQEQISELSERLRAVQGEEEERGRREAELRVLRACLAGAKETVGTLEGNLLVMSEQANESAASHRNTQESLTRVSEELAQIYHLVCEVNGETPNHLMFEHAQGQRSVPVDATKKKKVPTATLR